MYPAKPGLLIGFHGCDKKILNSIITGRKGFKSSANDYDWLGHGMYFWENNKQRALDFAINLKNNPTNNQQDIRHPAVLGAVIDLGFCLDLLDSEYLEIVKESYSVLREAYHQMNIPLPQNTTGKHSDELLVRRLDCMVIENVHKQREKNGNKAFDSVRGVFVEGKTLYPNAGFNDKNHIQICIRNPNCIKGFFLPLNSDNNFSIP